MKKLIILWLQKKERKENLSFGGEEEKIYIGAGKESVLGELNHSQGKEEAW